MRSAILSLIKKVAAVVAVGVGVALASGCAPKDWDAAYDGGYDPFEGLNRKTFALNKFADRVVMRPVARAYAYLPAAVRQCVGNALDNLDEPANAANNLLQAKIGRAGANVARFGMNSVFGIAGLFDPASAVGVAPAPEDFGQTLRHYGWKNPPHLVVPLLGPSSLADLPGTVADGYAGSALEDKFLTDAAQYGILGLSAVHFRAEFLEESELAEEAALDEYAFIRDAYEDYRQRAVRDGAEAEDDYDDDFEDEDEDEEEEDSQ